MLLLPLTLITSLSLLHTFVEGSFKLITVEDKSSLSPAEMFEKNNLANNDYSENPKVSRNRAFKCSGGAQCSQSAQSGRAQEFECTDGSTCERQVTGGGGEQHKAQSPYLMFSISFIRTSYTCYYS